MSERPYIGGQAVIEGVMMRAPCGLSVAVRRPDGALVVRDGPVRSKIASGSIWKLPGLRGIATLVESLTVGMEALRFSASQQMTEEEEEQSGGVGARLATFVSVLVAIALFKALPQLLTAGTSRLFGLSLDLQNPAYHALTGVFQLSVIFSYLLLISRIPDIRRVFQYHGAEHKTISAYEQQLPLTVENVRKQTTLHPRCGTTFLVVVAFVSVLFGVIVTPLVLPHAEGVSGFLQTLLLRVALLVPVAAVSFELQRFSARYCTTGPLRVFLWPGFLFQKITTREPDDRQIEVAIAAMTAAIRREEKGASEGEALRTFAGLDEFLTAAA